MRNAKSIIINSAWMKPRHQNYQFLPTSSLIISPPPPLQCENENKASVRLTKYDSNIMVFSASDSILSTMFLWLKCKFQFQTGQTERLATKQDEARNDKCMYWYVIL